MHHDAPFALAALTAALFCLPPLTGVALASAPEPAEAPAVVRQRLFTNDGRIEVALAVGFTPVARLTRHGAVEAALGWNLSETWSLHLRGGYAFSGHTEAADDAGQAVLASDPTVRFKRVDDFSDLWELRWSALAAGRWMPIYGKFSLFAALPVHFGVYLVAGAGAGGFARDSLVVADLHETAVKPLFFGAIGGRLYLTRRLALNLELADRFFPDSYRVDIDRLDAGDTGRDAASPGLTHLVFLSLGASISF